MIKCLMKKGNDPAVDIFEYDGEDINLARKAAKEQYKGHAVVRVWKSCEPSKPPATLRVSDSPLIMDILKKKQKYYRNSETQLDQVIFDENDYQDT